jgi:ABC-type dipeptide/oligopeptide/nickel transport system permease component
MGTTIFLAALVIILSFTVDILYKVIDPRIQLSDEQD